MIDIVVVLTAKNPADLPLLRDLIRTLRELSLQEPGCLRYEPYESETAANTFLLVERWESQAALDAHRAAHGFQTIYAPRVLPLVDRVPYICHGL